jgi:hypothetical protein
MPAPISDNASACSNSSTSWPPLRRQQAAVRPPIPAPAIAIFLAIEPHSGSGSFEAARCNNVRCGSNHRKVGKGTLRRTHHVNPGPAEDG